MVLESEAKVASQSTIEILHPGGKLKEVSFQLAPRPRKISGLTVGFLDNGKSNADVILERLQELVVENCAPGETVEAPRRRPGNTYFKREIRRADQFILDLSVRAHVVINGVGD